MFRNYHQKGLIPKNLRLTVAEGTLYGFDYGQLRAQEFVS